MLPNSPNPSLPDAQCPETTNSTATQQPHNAADFEKSGQMWKMRKTGELSLLCGQLAQKVNRGSCCRGGGLSRSCSNILSYRLYSLCWQNRVRWTTKTPKIAWLWHVQKPFCSGASKRQTHLSGPGNVDSQTGGGGSVLVQNDRPLPKEAVLCLFVGSVP